ncbi:zonadhesin-like [Armigeres subalbatus]|uniref:zonadhesin-like n=1 Tax=Armigeres subalbatus TaxID=124917 RepID=UPI002ED3F766
MVVRKIQASIGAVVLLFWILQLQFSETLSSGNRKQLKDHQLKKPLNIRARRYCTDADCIKTCPLDYELDNEKQFCRYQRSICPPNYIQRHGSCVLAEVQCPPGSVRQGNRCVVKTMECPSGYTMEGNNCINTRYCPEGYHWENGFCYRQQRSQVCPNGYENRNGICIQICVNCDAACSQCDEEIIPLKCPAGYDMHRGKCLKIVQGRADIVLRNVTYRVPVECENEGVYNNGICMHKKFESPRCESGSFYAGRCVEIAKCSQGVFTSDCECGSESSTAATCRQGLPSSAGCVISNCQCRKPAQLVGEVCEGRLESHRAFCASGTPYNNIYCTLNAPRCPAGFLLEGSFCVRNMSYAVDCGRYQWNEGWCSSAATCEAGYKLQENGDCVREMRMQREVCPSGTTYDGEHCISNAPLCEPDHEYDERFGICVKCVEQAVVCDTAAGYQHNNGTCVKYDPLCPSGYVWKDNHCISKSSSYVQCESGHVVDNYCVHSHLNCPDNQELVDGVCIHQEIPNCPEGSVYQNGLCMAAKQCPAGYTVGQHSCVEETRTSLNKSINPECRYGFRYERGNCIKTIQIEAIVDSRPLQCAIGYTLTQGKCVKVYHGLLVCPPKTIHMNQENKCFCKVDLVCPNGYEKIGDECVFRSMGYFSPYLNFLNPCYGLQCSLQYCLSQCFSPPCPVQPCSYGVQQFGAVYGGANHQPSDICGIGESCVTQENLDTIVNLTCPPGYQKENNTCIAYYNRVCQNGYTLEKGACLKIEETSVMCPLGFTLSNGTCVRIRCDAEYTREGTICRKMEYHSPSPCQKNYIYIEGICLHKTDCLGGSVEDGHCVRRRYENFQCPPKFTQLNESCVQMATCSGKDMFFAGTTCQSTEQIQLRCPAETKRVKNMCVYDNGTKFEKIKLLPPQCNGKVIQQDQLCSYIETPACGKGYVLKNGRCVTCSSKTPQCATDMVIINRKCIKYHKPCRDGWYLTKDGQCVAVNIRSATCSQGKLAFNRCIHGFPSCKSGYTMEGNRCVYKERTIARCNEGILLGESCFSMLQCNGPDFVLSNGWCIRDEHFEPTCNSRTARKRDKCISGILKCPENHYQFNGQCFLHRTAPAECPNNVRCLENFCPIAYPSCSASFNFDGSVCTKVISHAPTCPTGTIPVSTDRDYCQYSTEQADFHCPSEYNFKNGVCQKRQYMEASCPNGFRKKMDACARRACGSAALTIYCGTHGLGPSSLGSPLNIPHLSAQRPFNATISAVSVDEVCCHIYSPRICRYNEGSDEWNCFHTENRRCGTFCKRPEQHVYLRTAESYYFNNILILLPPEHVTNTRIEHLDEDDDYVVDTKPNCDGCTDRSYDCDNYCYTYDCQIADSQCEFKDQREFCSAHPGPGCTTKDGCYSRDFCVVD